MNTQTISRTIATQLVKNQKLTKEFAWISKEFANFCTLDDLDLDNADKYALGIAL